MRLMTLLFLLGSTSVFAAHETFETRIHSIIYGEEVGEEHLFKFQNARTGLMDPKLKIEAAKGELVQVEVDEKNRIVKLEKLVEPESVEYNPPFITRITYIPTELRDLNAAKSLMNEFRGSALKTSESFNRSHVWAFEAFQKENLFSMKAFILFSHRYIRQERLKIWFYVSPYVLHGEMNGTKEAILDRTLSKGPLDFKTWTSRFMKNQEGCQEIKNYSIYYKKASAANCFVMKASMFFWHPEDLERMEIEGIQKVNFFEWELAEAYQNAFGI